MLIDHKNKKEEQFKNFSLFWSRQGAYDGKVCAIHFILYTG